MKQITRLLLCLTSFVALTASAQQDNISIVPYTSCDGTTPLMGISNQVRHMRFVVATQASGPRTIKYRLTNGDEPYNTINISSSSVDTLNFYDIPGNSSFQNVSFGLFNGDEETASVSLTEMHPWMINPTVTFIPGECDAFTMRGKFRIQAFGLPNGDPGDMGCNSSALVFLATIVDEAGTASYSTSVEIPEPSQEMPVIEVPVEFSYYGQIESFCLTAEMFFMDMAPTPRFETAEISFPALEPFCPNLGYDVAMDVPNVSEVSDPVIMPNPCTDFTEVANLYGWQAYTVRDSSGRSITNGKVTNGDKLRFDTTSWASGVYIATFFGPHGPTTTRLIRQ